MERIYAIKKADSDNELVHYKYIKRVKGPNGKWRYYYDKESLKNDVKDKLGVDELERMNKAEKKVLADGATLAVAKTNLEQNNDNRLIWENDGKGNMVAEKYTAAYMSAGEKYAKSVEQYDKATKEFYRTPMGAIPGITNTIAEGLEYLKKKFK